MSAPHLVIAAGGTGGHMFPAQALAEAMVRKGWRVKLSTDARGARYTGGFPHVVKIEQVASATAAVEAEFGGEVELGIHAHNDAECGVANSLAAVRAGVRLGGHEWRDFAGGHRAERPEALDDQGPHRDRHGRDAGRRQPVGKLSGCGGAVADETAAAHVLRMRGRHPIEQRIRDQLLDADDRRAPELACDQGGVAGL